MNDVTQFWTIFDLSSVVTLFRNKAIVIEYLTLASSPYDRDVIYVQSQILFFSPYPVASCLLLCSSESYNCTANRLFY